MLASPSFIKVLSLVLLMALNFVSCAEDACDAAGSASDGCNAKSSPKSDSSVNAAFKYKEEAQEQCFCRLKGQVDDCSCDVDTADYFNNMKIFPRMQSLLAKDFFRYFEYNPHKGCKFYDQTSTNQDRCNSQGCKVTNCPDEKLPPGFRDSSKSEERPSIEKCEDNPEQNDKVDITISDSAREGIRSWRDYDARDVSGFCEVDGGHCKGCVYVDLMINPERYTGYDGIASHKIWKAVYKENCFRPQQDVEEDFDLSSRVSSNKKKLMKLVLNPEQLESMCLEKRAFYRAVSGLHSSITIHLSARYPGNQMESSGKNKKSIDGSPSSNGLDRKSFSLFPATDDEMYRPNLKLFLSRFNPQTTNGQGPFWLRNLYFVYLLELRAILKASSYLEKKIYYTGNLEEDRDTQVAVKEMLEVVGSFQHHFDESQLFTSSDTSDKLKEEFRDHFRNISRVMDCVSCDKCKLWGKLQVTGLGTALKILFSENSNPATEMLGSDDAINVSDLQLTRNEVVALFNAFGRISTSIRQLEVFRQMMREDGAYHDWADISSFPQE